jgi:hypothetical protein
MTTLWKIIYTKKGRQYEAQKHAGDHMDAQEAAVMI